MVFIKGFDLRLFFPTQRESCSFPNMNFFCQTVIYFVRVIIIKDKIAIMHSKYCNGDL